jgi:hypothetical protein
MIFLEIASKNVKKNAIWMLKREKITNNMSFYLEMSEKCYTFALDNKAVFSLLNLGGLKEENCGC